VSRRHQAAVVNAASDTAELTRVDRAAAPIYPVAPKRYLYLTLGVLLGGLAGGGLTWLVLRRELALDEPGDVVPVTAPAPPPVAVAAMSAAAAAAEAPVGTSLSPDPAPARVPARVPVAAWWDGIGFVDTGNGRAARDDRTRPGDEDLPW
jgi:hypothetical protein